MNLNKYIDHTVLKADANIDAIDKVVSEALEYDFASVCINPTYVKYVSEKLKGSDVKTCTVIGFPLGSNTTATKVFETKDAVSNGATEIDMVINLTHVKQNRFDLILEEINQIKDQCNGNVLKVIVETCLLTEEEKSKICNIVLESNADFIKTSTGMSTGGATLEDITLFNSILQGKKEIKASGGVRDKEFALKLIEAGATRLGTSGGVQIVSGEENTSSY